MNELTNLSPDADSLDLVSGLKAINPVRSKRDEGRVPYILTDQQALYQWHRNLEKLRLKDAPDRNISPSQS